jgi:hypothetical protein
MTEMELFTQSNKSQIVNLVVVAVLGLLTVVSLGRSIHFTFFTPIGGIDFHSYWYAGLFIRQRTDPFAAYLSGQEPDSPVDFIGNGAKIAAPPRGGPLATVPANTAPIVLLLSLFSWLPWSVAKTTWYIFNFLLVLILPWLTIRWLPRPNNLGIMPVTLFFLSFYALKGTRAALGTGQTTLLVLTLMLLCLLTWERSWLLAGLFLGIALSKYSIALPLFLYALFRRKYRVMVVAVLVQLLSLLILSAITGSRPFSIVQSNYQIMQRHINFPGIYLAELFDHGSTMRLIAPVVLTVLMLVYLVWYTYRQPRSTRFAAESSFRGRHMMAAFALWTLLVAYHRPYDGVLVIFFMAIVLYGFSNTDSWQISPRQQSGLGWFVVIAITMLIVPYEQIGSFLPPTLADSLLDFIAKGVVVTLVAMLAVTLWLMARARTEALGS